MVSVSDIAYLVKPFREQDRLAAIPLAVQRFLELQSLRAEASSMRQALEDRKTIERAKGILVSKLHQSLVINHRSTIDNPSRQSSFLGRAIFSLARHFSPLTTD
jgi:hypothetical protein